MRICVILAVLLCVVAYGGLAKTIRVPEDISSYNLHKAIDIAQPGDEILLGSHEWSFGYSFHLRPLVIEKSIIIRGAGTSKTVFRGDSDFTIITISSNTGAQITIKDLSIRTAGWEGGWRNISYIVIKGNVKVTFENVVFKNVHLSLSENADVYMRSVKIDSFYEAISINDQAALHLTNCNLLSEGEDIIMWSGELHINESELNGVGRIHDTVVIRGGQAEFMNSQIHNSQVSAISFEGSKMVLKDCSIQAIDTAIEVIGGNVEVIGSTISSERGSAIEISSGSLVIDRCQIKQSETGISGGGDERGYVRVSESAIFNNSIGISSGGEIIVEGCEIYNNGEAGISLYGTARALITDSVVKDNVGWGIVARDHAVAVGWGNTVTGNQRDLFGVSDWLVKPKQPVDKKEIHVPKDVPAIEEAVYRVAEGGTIVVESGDYSQERAAIYKKINLEGRGQDVVLGGISFFSDLGDVRVSNLAIIGKKVWPSTGIVVSKGTYLQLEGCMVSKWGRGLRLLSGSTAIVSNSTISKNEIGIEDSSATLILQGCNMSSNERQAISSSSRELKIEGCTIRDNGSKHYPDAAIYFSGESLLTRNSVIEGNYSCGVEVSKGVGVSSSNCQIENSFISKNGAGVCCEEGSLVIRESRIINNRGSGIGILSGDLTVINTEVAFNRYGVYLGTEYGEIRKLIAQNVCIHDNSFRFSLQDRERIDQTVQALDAGTIPDYLRAVMDRNVWHLSYQVSVEVVRPGEEWRISDQEAEKVFIIKLENRILNIYNDSPSDLVPSPEQYPWPVEFEECTYTVDTTPPSVISDFSAKITGEREVTLSWTNPDDPELSEVVIRRKTDGWPADHTDGTLVFRDPSPSPGSRVEFADKDLAKGQTYYYAIFSRDSAGNWNDTVRQGSNADTVEITGNHPPETPLNLAQLLTNETEIPVGGAVETETVLFKATVTDPDGDMVKLQVELRRLDELNGGFDETYGELKETKLVPSGSEVTCLVEGLIPAKYHWRARTVDEHGLVSDWVEFGRNPISEADFTVMLVDKEPPHCVVQLREEGSTPPINETDMGRGFDIYVGGSTDDTGIEAVRFSSDDDQDGQPTGVWTEWYAWEASSGDWDAETKTMSWTFTSIGEKEVWAEVKDKAGHTARCHADIKVTPVKKASAKFEVGEYVRVKQATLMRREPGTDSAILHKFGEKTIGKILQNENNGVFLNGYYWWYLEARDGIFSFSGWCREVDLEKNQLPEAAFTYSPTTFRCGEDVTLDASESSDPDGAVVAYRWDLDGDGEYDGYTTSPQIVYYWDEPGDYRVTLEVEDDTHGTSKTTKVITVRKNSIWERLRKKLEDFFGSPPKFSHKWLKEIKTELQIKNWSQEVPVYDPDPLNPFYNYGDDDLAAVLVQEMDRENNPGITYGVYILDSIREKKLIEIAASPAWQNEEAVNEYFNDLIEINTWAEEGQLLSKEILVGLIKTAGGSGIGISTVLGIPKLCEAGIGLKALDDTLFRRALWNYFTLRMADYSPSNAFDNAEVPPHYRKDETREYFESLWNTYQKFGSKADFVTTWRSKLRAFLLATLEKYKFYKRIVTIKSAGELRIYDSKGRVTGVLNGVVKEEIPGSIYDKESKTAIITSATDTYRYMVVGKEQGSYGLEVIFIDSGESNVFSATDMPIADGVTHQYTIDWDALAEGKKGTLFEVDSDGDGTFEKAYRASAKLDGSNLAGVTPPEGAANMWLWIVLGVGAVIIVVIVGAKVLQ